MDEGEQLQQAIEDLRTVQDESKANGRSNWWRSWDEWLTHLGEINEAKFVKPMVELVQHEAVKLGASTNDKIKFSQLPADHQFSISAFKEVLNGGGRDAMHVAAAAYLREMDNFILWDE